MEAKQIIESTAGLEAHLRQRGVGKDYKLTALTKDTESGWTGYALHDPFSTPTMPGGCTVAGVYKEGKYAEKYFSSIPIREIDVRNIRNLTLSAKTREMQFPISLEFSLTELKDSYN